MSQLEKNLKRRMWRGDGIYYFCRICGDYLHESSFYKSTKGPFKIDTKCKIHYSKREKDDNGEMDYLKLNPLTDNDFIGAQNLLERLGYTFDMDSPPVHIQFHQRHKNNLKSNNNNNGTN